MAIGTHEQNLVLSLHNFELAMGMALHPRQLAVGTRQEIWFLQAVPDLAPTLDPPGKYDACLLTRKAHFTGNIHGHEMGYCGDELWVCNTLFSCLSTLDDRYHFVPRWKPKFISAIGGPEDRCHLNGLAIAEGQVKYVTCLGTVDAPGGWRPDKAGGGVILDVASNEIVARGFAMPHSPRVYDGKLWVLDSGRGALCTVDLASGRSTVVTTFPGYCRGLSFLGPFAFVGLSRIRETAVFGGVPIAENRDALKCGIAVVDLRAGRSVASFEFAEGVEEIFDVQSAAGRPLPRVARTARRGRSAEPDLGGAAVEVMRLSGTGAGIAKPRASCLRLRFRLIALILDSMALTLNDQGIAAAKAGDFAAARRLLEQAVAAEPDRPIAFFNLTHVLLRLGDLPAAERAARTMICLAPQEADYHLTLAQVLLAQRRAREALVDAGHAARLTPTRADVLRMLADLLARLEQPAEAAAAYERLIAVAPQDAAALNELGNLYQRLGRNDEADRTYARAIEVDPGMVAVLANRARYQSDRGHVEVARKLYGQANRRQPTPQMQIAAAATLPIIYDSVEHVRQERASLVEAFDDLLAQGVRIDPTRFVLPNMFYLAYQGENDREVMTRFAQLLTPPEHRARAATGRLRAEANAAGLALEISLRPHHRPLEPRVDRTFAARPV